MARFGTSSQPASNRDGGWGVQTTNNHGRDEESNFVDQSGIQQRSGNASAAFDQHTLNLTLAKFTQHAAEVSWPAFNAHQLYAELLQKNTEDSCCRRKMFDQPDQAAPNLADPNAPCLDKNMIAAQK